MRTTETNNAGGMGEVFDFRESGINVTTDL